MQIESKIKRQGGSHIPMGDVTYHFAPQEDGAHVATVDNEAHQDRFLSITDGFRLYRPGQVPAAASVALLGSADLAGPFHIHGKDYTADAIIMLAHTTSSMSAEDWNDLDEATRADMMEQELDKLEAAGPAAPKAPKAPKAK